MTNKFGENYEIAAKLPHFHLATNVRKLHADVGNLRATSTQLKKGISTMNGSHGNCEGNGFMISQLMMPVFGYGLEFGQRAFVLLSKFLVLPSIMYLCLVQTSMGVDANMAVRWLSGHSANPNWSYNVSQLTRAAGTVGETDGRNTIRGTEVILEFTGNDLPTQTGVQSSCCGHNETIGVSVLEQKYDYNQIGRMNGDHYNPWKGPEERFQVGTLLGHTDEGEEVNLVEDRFKDLVNRDSTKYFVYRKNLQFGHWAVDRGGTIRRGCTILHSNTGTCRFFKFYPNTSALATKLKPGETVRSVLNVRAGDQQRHFIVRITRTENVRLAWTDGNRGRIEGYDDNGEYRELHGQLEINAIFPRIIRYEATERRGIAETVFNDNDTVIRDEVEEFVGTEVGIGDNFKFGTWWIERGVVSPRFIFKPKFAIDELSPAREAQPPTEGSLAIPAMPAEEAISVLTFSIGDYDRQGRFRQTNRVNATVTITGTGIPVISFTESKSVVDEFVGGKSTVNIFLEADTLPVGGVKLNYTAQNVEGNYLDTSNGTLVPNSQIYEFSTAVTFVELLSQKSVRNYLSVLEMDILAGDSEFNRDGTILVQLQEGNGYKLPDSAAKSTIIAELRDKRWPTVSIYSDKTVLTEGQDEEATVTFETDITRHGGDLNMYYSVDQGNHDFISSSDTESGKFVVLDEGVSSLKTSVSITIIDDSAAEANGEVVVTLLPDPNDSTSYSLGANRKIVFTVQDDDTTQLPVPTDTISFSWSPGNVGAVNFADKYSIPAFAVGTIEDRNPAAVAIDARAREERFSTSGTKHRAFSASPSKSVLVSGNFQDLVNDAGYVGYPPHPDIGSLEKQLGENFNFGVWYFKQANSLTGCTTGAICTNVLFIPNVENLETLGVGESVTAVFRYQSVADNGDISVEEVAIKYTRAASASSQKPIVSLEAPAFTSAPNRATVTARVDRPSTQTATSIPVTFLVQWDQGPKCNRASNEVQVPIPAGETTQESSSIVFLSGEDGTDCRSMTAILQASSSYEVDTRANSVGIVEDGGTNGIYISAHSRSIPEGGSVELLLNTNARNTLLMEVRQEVELTWRPAGLVTEACGKLIASFVTSVTCSGDGVLALAALETSSVEANRITVVTSSSVLEDLNGIITATLAGDIPDCCIVHPTKSTVDVIVLAADAPRPQFGAANLSALSQLGGAIGSHSLNAAARRVDQAFNDSGGFSFELGGNSTIDELLLAGIESMDLGMQSWQEVFGDSSFEIGLFPEEAAANSATVWGLGDYRSLSDNRELDGNVFTGHFGFDVLAGKGMVAGLATSVAWSEMEYEGSDYTIAYQTRTTGVHPYVGIETANGDQAHFIAGYGLGEIELDQKGYETEILDTDFFNLGAGGDLQLYASDSIFSGGTSELSINGESWLVNQFVTARSDVVSDMQVNVRHLRMSIVGTHQHKLDNDAMIIPEVAVGLREDGMKRQSFFGMEMDAGLSYSNNHGYVLSGTGELLLSDTSRIQEWGIAGNFAYDSFGDRLGVLVDFTPAWGQVAAAKDSVLWSKSILSHEFDSEMYTDGTKVDAEFGYGFNVWDDTGVLTPYGAVALVANDDDAFSIGSRLRLGSDIEFGLEGSRILKNNEKGEGEVRLDSSIKW